MHSAGSLEQSRRTVLIYSAITPAHRVETVTARLYVAFDKMRRNRSKPFT